MEPSGAIEIVAIDENSALGNVGVMVVDDPVVVPIVSPVSPAPAETAKKADSKTESERNSGTREEQPRIPIPAGPDPDGFAIDEPRVILRHVNNLRIGWFDHNGLPLLAYVFLRGAF